MPRPTPVDPPQRLEVQIPLSVLARVKLELHSDLEGKVPFGQMSGLVSRLLRDWLEAERGISL